MGSALLATGHHGVVSQEEQAALSVYITHLALPRKCFAHSLPKLLCDQQMGLWAQQLLAKLKLAAGCWPGCLGAYGRTAAPQGTRLCLDTSNIPRACPIRPTTATKLASELSETNEQMLHAAQQDTPLVTKKRAPYSCLASSACHSASATAHAPAL